jgi:putative nucleotidyltransferase with HDIG domain
MSEDFKILLVEDDDGFREVLKSVLDKRYKVTTAVNGRQAKEYMTLEDFSLVISDVQMPYLSGTELLEWIRASRKATRVILCTGFAQILETKTAADLGADDFLAKPFSALELIEKIEKFRTTENSNGPSADAKPTSVDLDSQFCKVPIEDFISEKNTEYGVFIRISNEKYIKVAHQGGKLDEDRVKHFKDKGIHFLYIKKEDFDKLVGFAIFVNNAIVQSDAVATEKKIRFMRYTGELIMEHVFVKGMDQKAFLEAKDFLNSTLDIISKDQNVFSILNTLNQHTDYLYVHSLAVANFAYMVAKSMGYTNAPILFKIAMGGLLHDVGKKEFSKEFIMKPRHQWSSAEIQLYESHPIRGKEILESMANIPTEVVTIAYEHHENNIGQGFPRKLDRKRINPLAQIVSVANIFAEYVIKRQENQVILSPMEALQKIEFHKKDYVNEQVLESLKRIFINK